MVKNPPVTWETQVRSLGREAPLEEGMATHSSTLAGRIPWTEEPGGLQSVGSQRGRHDWATNTCEHTPQSYFSFLKFLGCSYSLFFHANFTVSFLVSIASSRYFYEVCFMFIDSLRQKWQLYDDEIFCLRTRYVTPVIQIIDLSLCSIFSFLPWDFSYFSLSIFLGVAFPLVSVINGIFSLIYSVCLLFLHRENIDFFFPDYLYQTTKEKILVDSYCCLNDSLRFVYIIINNHGFLF